MYTYESYIFFYNITFFSCQVLATNLLNSRQNSFEINCPLHTSYYFLVLKYFFHISHTILPKSLFLFYINQFEIFIVVILCYSLHLQYIQITFIENYHNLKHSIKNGIYL